MKADEKKEKNEVEKSIANSTKKIEEEDKKIEQEISKQEKLVELEEKKVERELERERQREMEQEKQLMQIDQKDKGLNNEQLVEVKASLNTPVSHAIVANPAK